MLTGIFVVITLLPFRLFFEIYNGIFALLGISLDIPIPDAFASTMISVFQKAYVFDYIFPTTAFINITLLAVNFFIALRLWLLLVWIYNRIRGA